MKKLNFIVESNESVAKDCYRMDLCCTDEQYRFSGEFVELLIEDCYLRRPLSVADSKDNRITLIYKVVGEGTKILSEYCEGRQIDVLTDLGRGFDAACCKQKALLLGGGLGAAPLYMLAKELKAQGKTVEAVLGFGSEEEIVLEEEFSKICDSLTIATMDGSKGIKGTPCDVIKQTKPSFDFYYCCGPMVMMKSVSKMLPGKGEASLEERMGCGAGFCYGCSINTAKGPKRVCKDGPVFKTEDLLW